MDIRIDDLRSPAIAALLDEHLRDMYATSPPESVHALDLERLRRSDITFWTLWDGDALAGCAALKSLGNGEGEIKSMRTARAFRHRGVASRLLRHLLDEAGRRGYQRLWLETGSMDYFAAARALYTKFGFVECGPFADYELDPYSVFMSKDLAASSEATAARAGAEHTGNVQLIRCNLADHGAAILAIFNEAIRHSTAIYEYEPRTAVFMQEWFADKDRHDTPVIGATGNDGQLLGFASYGSFRAKPAYKYSVEHSVYVRSDQRGRGIGRRLLQAVVEEIRARDYHVIVAGIDAENTASIALHAKCGFEYAGTIKQAGYKFGRWLDLVFYQRLLDTPAHPKSG